MSVIGNEMRSTKETRRCKFELSQNSFQTQIQIYTKQCMGLTYQTSEIRKANLSM